MRTEEEIRLQRLAAVKALEKFPKRGWQKIMEEIAAGRLEGDLLLATIVNIGIISDTLSWLLGESAGKGMQNAISQVENLGRYFKTGKFLPRWDQKKALSALGEIIKEAPNLRRKILEDQKNLLGIDWNDLQSKE